MTRMIYPTTNLTATEQMRTLTYSHLFGGKTHPATMAPADTLSAMVAAAALTGLPSNHTHFSLPFAVLGVLRTGSPRFYRDGLPGESEEEFASRGRSHLCMGSA